MNKLFLLFSLLVFSLFSCRDTKEQTETTDSINTQSIHVKTSITDTLITPQESDTSIPRKDETINNQLSPMVMHDNVPFYSEIRDTSIIKKHLPIFTPCKIIEKGGLYTEQITTTSFLSDPQLKIKYPTKYPFLKIEIDGDSGYVSANDICYYHLKNPNRPIYYFITTNESDVAIVIYKYDRIRKKVLDSLQVIMGGSDSEFIPDFIKLSNTIALRNVQSVIEIHRVDEYCGGGEFSIFVIDANESLKILSRSGSYGEVCEGSSITMTFPFIKNGDTLNIIDWKQKGLKEKIDKIVKNQKIPVHHILPENHYSYNAVYDENGEPMVDKDGYCKEEVTLNYTLLYSWNGYKLNKLDSVNHLK